MEAPSKHRRSSWLCSERSSFLGGTWFVQPSSAFTILSFPGPKCRKENTHEIPHTLHHRKLTHHTRMPTPHKKNTYTTYTHYMPHTHTHAHTTYHITQRIYTPHTHTPHNTQTTHIPHHTHTTCHTTHHTPPQHSHHTKRHIHLLT